MVCQSRRSVTSRGAAGWLAAGAGALAAAPAGALAGALGAATAAAGLAAGGGPAAGAQAASRVAPLNVSNRRTAVERLDLRPSALMVAPLRLRIPLDGRCHCSPVAGARRSAPQVGV